MVWEADDKSAQIYGKELKDGSYGVAMLNRGSTTRDMSVSPRRDLTMPWDEYRVRDLWRHKDRGPYDVPFGVEVMAHEARVFRLTNVEDAD